MADLTPEQIKAIIAKLRVTEGPHTRPIMSDEQRTEPMGDKATASLDAYRIRYGDNHKNAQIRFQ